MQGRCGAAKRRISAVSALPRARRNRSCRRRPDTRGLGQLRGPVALPVKQRGKRFRSKASGSPPWIRSWLTTPGAPDRRASAKVIACGLGTRGYILHPSCLQLVRLEGLYCFRRTGVAGPCRPLARVRCINVEPFEGITRAAAGRKRYHEYATSATRGIASCRSRLGFAFLCRAA
jgi:hypothetical protein